MRAVHKRYDEGSSQYRLEAWWEAGGKAAVIVVERTLSGRKPHY